jgi:hypothetical protein
MTIKRIIAIDLSLSFPLSACREGEGYIKSPSIPSFGRLRTGFTKEGD